ncbi:MAG: NAD(P)/FAD-dependent oxidoreductase, partial [Bacillota bacterium]|nr:NAD(P)/FAD-dependent oxidoreductase [Bacillota bacterium]
AAINAKIRNKSILLFGYRDLSNKLMKAPKVNNYLGFYDITGEEMKKKFQEHMDFMGIEVLTERVNSVYAMGDYFAMMVNDKMYEAKALILATGMEYTKPLRGEEEFLGRGVGYCATCDAPLYRGKTITVVGYNREAEEEANYVSELAGKLYYIPMYKGDYRIRDGIEVINDKPLVITGGDRVTNLQLMNKTLDTDAVFILKDSISPGQLVPGLEMENGHIKVDRNMRTNLEGCYAAGDCTGKPYQYIKSAGEGLVAALSAVAYIDSKS